MIVSIIDFNGDLLSTLSSIDSKDVIITTDKKLEGYILLPKEGTISEMKNRAYEYYRKNLSEKGKFLDLLSGDIVKKGGNQKAFLIEGENSCEGWIYSKWNSVSEEVEIQRPFDLDPILLDPNEETRKLYQAHTLYHRGKADLSLFLECLELKTLRKDEIDYARFRAIELLLRDNLEKAEELSLYSERKEPLNLLCRHYRINGKNSKAYEKYLQAQKIEEKGLFHENVERSLQYEFTVFGYYVNKKEEALQISVEELLLKNCNNPNNIIENLEYYMTKLKGDIFAYKFPDYEDYTCSSCSLREDIMNVRYVNYRLDNKGVYTMKDGIVRTKNFYVRVGKDLTPNTWPKEMKEGERKVTDGHIKGIEDVRLYKVGNKLRFSSSCADIVKDKICITVGDYNIKGELMTSFKPLITPNRCEKNWLALDGPTERFIYSWSPYKIVEVVGDHLKDIMIKEMPVLFRDIRGSASPVKYGDGYLCLVHSVKYGNPRKYFHWFVYLSKDYTPVSISKPFFFESIGVEYCMLIKPLKNKLCLVYSKQDRDTTRIIIDSPCLDSFIPLYHSSQVDNLLL